MFSEVDVIDVLRKLARAGVTARVDGGWGVDALVGATTRARSGLDLVVLPAELPAALDVRREGGEVTSHQGYGWPTDKLTALRLGPRLVTEVPASRPGRRAFVDVTPVRGGTGFRVDHREYEADQTEGFDYDIGEELVRTASAADEGELLRVLDAWRLSPAGFEYPWNTDDPR
ncbi:nucleotidyltransferase domain-containing protein [Kitasatospora viridis]|uniref:Lincosamide nucleotidyltransferase A/C/D/E n=1 Tax=Kitasatospora viridis TaxID=281105 RepID=A0A561UBI2_9ACTN|nr:hypothetical protein [Kitasatospora viridis]TWF96715.1 hypothetical protein FHX73_11487 [Kitasatospora viridis]